MAIASPTHVETQCLLPEAGTAAKVLSVLRGIRLTTAAGASYDESVALTDAGFTSMEMVKIMLAIESAFDITIPQHEITPANFSSGASIAAMVEKISA